MKAAGSLVALREIFRACLNIIRTSIADRGEARIPAIESAYARK
jgi:hypothetical protein